MASVREIAKLAGVSKTTVAMVLKNKEGVSESMRQKVQEAISNLRTLEESRVAEEKAGAANGLVNAAMEEQPLSILVLHPVKIFTSAVFREIIRGVQAAASLYQVQLHLTFNDPDHLNDNFEDIYLSTPILRPKGLLVIGARISEPVVDRACEIGIPIILVGRRAKSSSYSSIGRNEEEIAREATGYLMDLGHRSIAFLGSSEKYQYTHDRLAGYQRAFAERGLALREDLSIPGFDVQAAAQRLLDDPQITAAIFVNELHASQVLPLVKAGGKRIPDDLSVVCFDDTSISQEFDPPLTTVSFPFFQEGFWAVRLLVEQIRHPFIESSHMVLRASLIKRKSCAPPGK